MKKTYRDERRKNFVNSNPITVLSVPIYLMTAADFEQYVARGRHCFAQNTNTLGQKYILYCKKKLKIQIYFI